MRFERIGRYDVTSLLGEGGMGQVWQATDTQLNRQVALKILPDAFADDPDRLARFQREAQVLASLNHPNIGGIHGIEEAEGTRALVLELVEGPTLADRISKGPIPLDEALPIAKQITEALEAAHEAGVIHRDLKPANIKVREDGTVKVLDFGLAKALETAPQGDPSQSPTLTAAATQMGVILGTAAYMSPEQARGKPVDKRTDIWAFGAVLFEMLTGTRSFPGDDVSQTLARVLDRDPDWDLLPKTLTPALGTYLRRCLQKNPRQRVRDIGDVRLAMEGAFDPEGRASPEPTVAPHLRIWQRPAPLVLAGVGLIAITAFGIWNLIRPEGQPVSRYAMGLPPGHDVSAFHGANLAISPDGSRIAYIGPGPDGTPMIQVRRRDQLDPAPVAGTENASNLVFSPDGQRIAYQAVGRPVIRIVSLSGAPPLTVAEEGIGPAGLSWGSDGYLYNGGPVLVRVADEGGPVERLTTPNTSVREVNHVWPQLLPNGRGVLFATQKAGGVLSDIELAVVDLVTGEHETILDGVLGRYVSTGHIVYANAAGALLVVPFDAERLEVTGAPVVLAEGVGVRRDRAPDLAISDEGTLVYQGGGVEQVGELVWVSRTGVAESVDPDWTAIFSTPDISPDGSRLAVTILESDRDIWIKQLDRGPSQRLTTRSEFDSRPAWTPDGVSVTYSSGRRDGEGDLWTRRADASVAAALEVPGDAGIADAVWSSDGEWLVYRTTAAILGEGGDILAIRPGVDTVPTPLVLTNGAVDALAPTLSPDGRWMAYSSNESGAEEIYVVPFPNAADAKFVVSSNGGREPLWSHGGAEIFYRASDGSMMAVDVSTSPDFVLGEQRVLFSAREYATLRFHPEYDVSADDQHFVMIRAAERAQRPRPLIVVENFFAELRDRVPN